MFQPWFVQLISVLAGVGACLSPAVIVAVAIVGYRQWKLELEGKERYGLARRIIQLSHEYAEKCTEARDPFSYPVLSAEIKRLHLPEAEAQVLNEHFERWKRLKPLNNVLQELKRARWEANVVLSREDADLIQPFYDFSKWLDYAMFKYFDGKLKAIQTKTYTDEKKGELRSFEMMVYSKDDDAFSKGLDKALVAIEARMEKYIR